MYYILCTTIYFVRRSLFSTKAKIDEITRRYPRNTNRPSLHQSNHRVFLETGTCCQTLTYSPCSRLTVTVIKCKLRTRILSIIRHFEGIEINDLPTCQTKAKMKKMIARNVLAKQKKIFQWYKTIGILQFPGPVKESRLTLSGDCHIQGIMTIESIVSNRYFLQRRHRDYSKSSRVQLQVS